MALPVEPLALVVATLVTVLAAIVQGTIGFGFAVLSVPILALIDPRLAPVPQLVASLPLTAYMAYRERHALELRAMAWILVGRLPGAWLGAVLLGLASQRALDALIGTSVLVAIAILASSAKIPRTRETELLAGTASGVFDVVAAIGGPPLALVFREERGPTIRANLALIFTIGDLVSIGTRAAAGRMTSTDLVISGWLLPAVFAGMWVSRPLLPKMHPTLIRRGVFALSTIAALGLFVRVIGG